MEIEEGMLNEILDAAEEPTDARLEQILRKAEEKKGLDLEEVAELLKIEDGKKIEKLFAVSSKIKNEIYGNRLVLFAPLYLSSFCVNDCAYCGFHVSNSAPRKQLTMDEIKSQTEALLGMGHKRLLLEAGEHPINTIDYVCDAIKTIYSVRVKNSNIRRLNVNIAATTKENYAKLKEAKIGTYQLFQETYHPETYAKMHKGPKASYERQINAIENAYSAGIDDVGIGVLFGLYDYRFEVLSLVSHAKYLDEKNGVGPHTISVPRWRPAPTVNVENKWLVSDEDFLKLISILRLAVPYTGMIISTRETPELRKKAFEIGISQTSAASATSPGGYTEQKAVTQFELSDHRSVDEVVNAICEQGYLPSFCTACYRSGRTGDDFMVLAKSGNIHNFCHPNAILTFKEYLLDFASEKTRIDGEAMILRETEKITNQERKEELKSRLIRLENGERDLYF